MIYLIFIIKFILFISLHTETGGILLSPRPAPDDSPVKPEYPMRPFFGVEPVLLDEKVLYINLHVT